MVHFTRGKVYFLTGYYDRLLTIPYIQTLIYLGKNLRNGDKDLHYFKKPFFSENAIEISEDLFNFDNDKGIILLREEDTEAVDDVNGLIKTLSILIDE